VFPPPANGDYLQGARAPFPIVMQARTSELAQAVEPQAPRGEFHFTQQDFEQIRTLIHARAGIAINSTKRQMVYSRIGRRLRDLDMSSFGDYLEMLNAAGPDDAEWQAFTNALTTNLTSFFREEHHFPVLAELLRQAARHRPLTLWCSASSTGEEPYSIAMTVLDALGPAADVRILATDVDTNVLAEAEQGIYPVERLERLPTGFARRFFLKGGGSHAGSAKVRPEVRALVRFRQLNLLEENWPIRGPLDAIFCRNVMIYFDKPTQRTILERFAPLLRTDGLLFMGHSESLQHAGDLFRLRGKTVYVPVGGPRGRHA
jgi:chemotaxis protein methyltransferase CheR